MARSDSAPPRSFLLTVHEPGSAVLEELNSGRRVHVTAIEQVGELVAHWLADEHGEPPARPARG